ncbi:hypothetical protein GPECTOR_1g355 [Gonium pectorale]|uniref:Uncharacterized protein n=1 Tax=Gonium pectorale TaxID=33097 RepID=A0A150H2K7_GONPE|nr:hypothetical protein GPECTOR_1g355 [Gonium pectorale]|eukprot:KXZ56399.1 hypothetical protein GPECTOR_1g355 [Gonium pectorale]
MRKYRQCWLKYDRPLAAGAGRAGAWPRPKNAPDYATGWLSGTTESGVDDGAGPEKGFSGCTCQADYWVNGARFKGVCAPSESGFGSFCSVNTDCRSQPNPATEGCPQTQQCTAWLDTDLDGQVRSSLRDAANEAHVRTGGKAVVLTLLYMEGTPQAPCQAFAFGKPAAAFVEAHKDLVTSFEEACREHFKEQQLPPGAAQAQQQQRQETQVQAPQSGPLPLPLAQLQLGAAAGLASPTPLTMLPVSTGPSAQRPGAATVSVVPPSHLLPAAAISAQATGATGFQPLPPGVPLSSGPLAPGQLATGALPVDLESIISATLADPGPAIARCREARVSGEVLARLPQAMQLTVLMQTGMPAGEAASVVVELESRLRLLQPPALSIAALAHQVMQSAVAAAGTVAVTPPLHAAAQQPVAAHHVPLGLHAATSGAGFAVGSGGAMAAGPGPDGPSGPGPSVPSALLGPHEVASGEALQRSLGPLHAALAAAAALGSSVEAGWPGGAAASAAYGALQLPGLLVAPQQGALLPAAAPASEIMPPQG